MQAVYSRTVRRSEAAQLENVWRLTPPHEEVTSTFETLELSTAAQKAQQYSTKSSKAIIKENWDAKIRFPGDYKCPTALAILSSATCGQPRVRFVISGKAELVELMKRHPHG